MPFLIDGHNLIGQMPGLSLDDPDDEQKLIELLRAYLVRTDRKGTVVFDRGLPGGGARWSNVVLDVRFAPAPKKADDLIRERLERERNPRGLIVVTADRELAQAAERAGAQVRRPVDFARDMSAGPKAPPKKESGLTAAEVEEWERTFRAGKPSENG
jgi:predicted RNA-binding protein with PIN domain